MTIDMKNIFLLSALSALLWTACQKPDFDETVTGEALNTFTLNAPATNASIALNAATPNDKIEITWTASKPGVNTTPSYKWVAAQKTSGSLDAPLLELASDNSGKDAKLTLTQKQLDDALKAKGIADGAKADLIWSVKADNGSTQLLATEIRNISITRMKDGATSFILLGPASSNTVKAIDPNSTAQSMTFNWTKSVAATGGPAVKYKVLFAERKTDGAGNVIAVDWTKPLFAVSANNSGSDSLATITYKAISDSLTKYGFTNLTASVDLLWTVVATSGTWNQYASFQNEVMILREVKVFMVGSATPGDWTIENSTQLIADPRFPGTFFTYISLKAGEFKFVNGQAWPPAPGAIDWGQDPAAPAGTIAADGENNIAVSTAGIYRVTIDLTNKKYYVQTASAGGIGTLGLVGGFQGWSPNTKVNMGYIGVNKFLVLQDFAANDEFKIHDGAEWDNGANNKARWFAVDEANGGKVVVDPGAGYQNMKWTGAAGRVRVIFNGTDIKNLKYETSPATEMRVVGNGMAAFPEWNPGGSPQMTYKGNGVWEITLALLADKEVKFLSGNDWGAFDYEDAGNGKIKYEGGDNFKTPTIAGNYTITLDEQNGTVTMVKVP
jgi:hypothetical protein